MGSMKVIISEPRRELILLWSEKLHQSGDPFPYGLAGASSSKTLSTDRLTESAQGTGGALPGSNHGMVAPRDPLVLRERDKSSPHRKGPKDDEHLVSLIPEAFGIQDAG